MSIYCHSECPRVSPATSYDSSRPLELSLIRLDGSTGSSQLVGAHGAFLTKISTFWSKNQWFSLISPIFLLNFMVFRQQVTRTWLTSTWGGVGRPHCVRTSFMDRFRGLTEHNCLKTCMLGLTSSSARCEIWRQMGFESKYQYFGAKSMNFIDLLRFSYGFGKIFFTDFIL